MKNVFLFSILISLFFIACENDPTSPPIPPESTTVKIKSLINNEAVYDSLYLDIEITGIENIVKVVAIIDGKPEVEIYSPPYQIMFKPYDYYNYYYFADSSKHNVYVKVYTNNDEITYQSDVIYFIYYRFSITSLTVNHLDNGSVSLNWEDNISSLDTYIIEGKKGNEPYSILDQVSPSENQYIVTGLDTNFTYSFRIKALKDTNYTYSREVKIVSVIGNIELIDAVTEGSSYMSRIIFNNDSTVFYTTDNNGYKIIKWDAVTRRVIDRINTNDYSNYPSLALIENKNLIAMYSDYYIKIFRLDNGQLVKTLNLDYSSSSRKIAYVQVTNRLYAGQNSSLFCYDANNDFACIDTISSNTIGSILVYYDKLIISDSYGIIKMVDSYTNSTIRTNYFYNGIYSICLNTSRNEVLISSGNYGLYSLDINTLIEKESFSTNYYYSRIDYYKNYIIGYYSSNLNTYNRDLQRNTMSNSYNFYVNDYLIDNRRGLILSTYDNQVRTYKFVTKWIDVSTSYY